MVCCNECKHEFEVSVRTRYIKDDIEEVFFNCPECNERYTAYYLNDKIKKQQKQIKNNHMNKYKQKQLKKQAEEEMNRLEEIYSTS